MGLWSVTLPYVGNPIKHYYPHADSIRTLCGLLKRAAITQDVCKYYCQTCMKVLAAEKGEREPKA